MKGMLKAGGLEKGGGGGGGGKCQVIKCYLNSLFAC